MRTSSPALNHLWLSLLGYSILFGLLHRWVMPRLGLPEGAVLLLCGVLASAVPLVWAAADGMPSPPRPAVRPRAESLVFLMSLAIAGNLVLSLLSPRLELLWKPLGLTALPAPGGDESLTLPVALYICAVGPLLEELVFRGVLMRRLGPAGARTAVLVSALCFGLVHHDLYQGLSAFWCGLVYGWAALRYGLGVSVGLHMAGNTVAVALQLLQGAGTAGALASLLLVGVPLVLAAAGGLRRLRRRTPDREPQTAAGRLQVWRQPLLWVLLAFDTVYLVLASFRPL